MLVAVEDETLAAQLQTPLLIATFLEIAAIVAVFVLWEPWARMRIYRREARRSRQLAVILIGVAMLLIWEGVIFVFNIQQGFPAATPDSHLGHVPRYLSPLGGQRIGELSERLLGFRHRL